MISDRIKVMLIESGVTLFLALVAGSIVAQTREPLTQNKITISDNPTALSNLLAQVEKQTGKVAIFNARNVESTHVVSLARTTGTLSQVLDGVLPAAGYAWQVNGDYIVVIEKPKATTAAITPQPSQEDFERAIREYTQTHIPQGKQKTVRYDTIRTVKPQDSIFRYPSSAVTPVRTRRAASTPYTRNTPPLLAVKTNLLWWAARGTWNIAGEVGLGKQTSLELSGGNNRWNFDGSAENNKKLAHWIIKPEFRYWLCERFNGHFFGVHALYSKYNVSGYDIPLLFEKEYRYEGKAYGAGISYGYHLPLSKRWGVEFNVGAGAVQMNYKKYACEKCGTQEGEYKKTYLGPTELGLKVIYMIK